MRLRRRRPCQCLRPWQLASLGSLGSTWAGRSSRALGARPGVGGLARVRSKGGQPVGVAARRPLASRGRGFAINILIDHAPAGPMRASPAAPRPAAAWGLRRPGEAPAPAAPPGPFPAQRRVVSAIGSTERKMRLRKLWLSLPLRPARPHSRSRGPTKRPWGRPGGPHITHPQPPRPAQQTVTTSHHGPLLQDRSPLGRGPRHRCARCCPRQPRSHRHRAGAHPWKRQRAMLCLPGSGRSSNRRPVPGCRPPVRARWTAHEGRNRRMGS